MTEKKLFIIAEIGVNHNGNIQNAIKLIDKASEAKCNAVKFQTFNAKKLLKKNTKLANYQSKNTKFTNMYDMIKKYSLSNEQFYNLKKYCSKKKIEFMSTPFDNDSAIFLNKLNMKYFKISSSDNQNYLLLQLIKQFKKKIFLSTGMLLNRELEKTLNFLSLKKKYLSILHCISDYPTKVSDSQLGNINNLKKYGYDVGFSDHTIGHISPNVAISLGATIIEKHVTLNNNMEGPDHKSSLEIKNLKNFVKTLNSTFQSTNIKERHLTKGESALKKIAKKSLYYNKTLIKNHKLKLNDIIALRPLSGGICPSKFKFILNKRINKQVKKFQIINMNHLKK